MELIRFSSRQPVKRMLVDGVGKFVKIASGFSHFILLDNEFGLYGLGSNFYGQLGVKQGINLRQMFGSYQGAEEEDFFDNPMHLEFLSKEKIIDVSSGNFHCSALSSDGNVFNWGANYLGNGALEATCQPQILVIPKAEDDNFAKISSNGNSSLVINKNGALFIWGCFPGRIQAKANFFQFPNDCLSFPVELCVEFEFDYALSNDSFLYLVAEREGFLEIWNANPSKFIESTYPTSYPIPLSMLNVVQSAPKIKWEKIEVVVSGLKFVKILPIHQRKFGFVALEENGRIFCLFRDKLIQLDGRYKDFCIFYHNILLFEAQSNRIFQLTIANEREISLALLLEAGDYCFDSLALAHEQLLLYTKCNPRE